MKTMGALIDRMTKAGVLLATGGLLPMSQGARVRVDDGKFTVIDGPYAESKEMVAGFALIEAASKDEAIRWAKEFLAVAGDGESEIRPLIEVNHCYGHSGQLAQETSTCGS
jgi:hypothetical protein